MDASAWVALEDTRQAKHGSAMRFQASLRSEGSRWGNIHTSVTTLVEAHGWLLHHLSKAHANRLQLRLHPNLRVHGCDRAQMERALERHAAMRAHEVEVADVINAEAMDEVGIRTIWSYDRDYETMGYERVG